MGNVLLIKSGFDFLLLSKKVFPFILFVFDLVFSLAFSASDIDGLAPTLGCGRPVLTSTQPGN
jgi:hypothetical protein